MMGKRETGVVYAALLPVVIGIVIATGAGLPCLHHLLYTALRDRSGFSAQKTHPDCCCCILQALNRYLTWLASRLLSLQLPCAR